MFILQKVERAEIVSVPTDNRNVEDLLTKEWLLTNERGGYSSSTIVGCNTRRYHGLLIGSLNPPVDRIMALANCQDMLIFGADLLNLSTFEFAGKLAPQGFKYLKRFRRDIGVHFDYQVNGLELTKSVYLQRDADTVALVYDFVHVNEPLQLALRPFVGLRDFHTLQKSYARLCSKWLDGGLLVRHDMPNSCELFLTCDSASFESDPQWWFNFIYRNDKRRGQNFTEDLWTPGFFKCRIDAPTMVVFLANISDWCRPEQLMGVDIKAVRTDLQKARNAVTASAKDKDEKLRTLCLAAEQFVVKRQMQPSGDSRRTTILAGFHWFADWGRDAFISLPGLLLATARFEDAKSVLQTFAAAVDEGMIPNRFDDRSDTAYFNSIDASLWFINAAFQYRKAVGDLQTFTRELLPAIRRIIQSYNDGTRFGICADADGLITAGDTETQLTWMDAKYEGVPFTPRCGKAVEINALWYDSLCRLAQFLAQSDTDAAAHYRAMAHKVETSFRELFWNGESGFLNDCIMPDGSADTSLRPNQIFAVSLAFSPLLPAQQKSVVNVVEKELLTPYGLRTLSPKDSRYKGVYAGPQQQRDQAYHQGTVWPYLMGAFVEAYLKVNDFSRQSKDRAAAFIEPLMRHLTEDACLGSVSEIFDGDEPHKPRGCIAQAWSIAELIRAYQLIHS